MSIELAPIPLTDKEEFSLLVNKYLEEHCSFQDPRIGPETVEDYIYFPEYWREKGRYPLYVIHNDQTVGFVLVRTVYDEGETFYQVSDFYIKPDQQRHGYGFGAVSLLWKEYPGLWELQVLVRNHVAYKFWTHCVERLSLGSRSISEVLEDDGMRYQFSFTVPHA